MGYLVRAWQKSMPYNTVLILCITDKHLHDQWRYYKVRETINSSSGQVDKELYEARVYWNQKYCIVEIMFSTL